MYTNKTLNFHWKKFKIWHKNFSECTRAWIKMYMEHFMTSSWSSCPGCVWTFLSLTLSLVVDQMRLHEKKSWNCLNGGSSRDFFTHDNSQGSCTPENELDLSLVYCYIHHHIIIREMVQQLELIKLISFSSENNFNLIFFLCWIKAMKNYFQLMHVHTKKKK